MILIADASRFAAALRDAGPGETLSLNAGTYVAPPGGFVIRRGLRLTGTHPLRDRIQGGTIIVPASPDDHAIRIEDGNVRLLDLIIRGPERPGNGDGIHLALPGTPTCVELERLMVWGVGRDGIHIEATDGSVNLLEIKSCISNRNGRHGLYVEHCFGTTVTGGYYSGNERCGIMLDNCDGALLWRAASQANQRSGPAGDFSPHVYVRGGAGHSVDGCDFEDFVLTAGGKCALTIENVIGARVTGCTFSNPTPGTSRGIVFRNRCRECVVDLNTWTRIARPCDIDATCRRIDVRMQAVKE